MLSTFKNNFNSTGPRPYPKIFSYGLADEDLSDAVYRELYMLNVAFGIGFFVSICLSVFYQWVSTTLVWFHVLSSFVSIGLFVVNIHFKNPILSGRLGCAFFFAFLFATEIILGGINSSSLAWFMVIPLAAGLSVGPRDAAFWAIASLLAIIVLYSIDVLQIYEAQVPASGHLSITNLVLNVFLFLVLGVLVVIGVNRYEILEAELARSVAKQEDEASIARILSETASAANEETNFTRAGKECLEIICSAQNWQIGRLWEVKETALFATSVWYFENPNLMQLKLSTIDESIDPKALARRAVQTDFAVLVSDTPADSEQWQGSFGEALGMRSQFAWPIFADGKVAAVMELFSENLIEYDHRTDNLVSHVATQLAHVRERELSREKIQQMAYLDHVTGLPNRFAYERELARILGRARRTENSVYVLFIELSNAKWIIDFFGHATSDQYLRHIGQLLEKINQIDLPEEFGVDPEDRVVARLSGDQFALVFAGMRSAHTHAEISEYIAAKLSSKPQFAQPEISTDIIIGIAQYPQDGTGAVELNRIATSQLAAAKTQKLMASTS